MYQVQLYSTCIPQHLKNSHNIYFLFLKEWGVQLTKVSMTVMKIWYLMSLLSKMAPSVAT
jgi:hypothetical protein